MSSQGKLYYYNAYITLNGEKTTAPFSRLLDDVVILEDEQKFKETRHGEYSLLKMRLPTQNRDVNDRSVCFANYRDRKPKVGTRRSSRLDDIADDVIEPTNCFYQHNNKLFIMEYNHYGAKANQLETYLSSFLPNTENNIWGVELVEIEAPIGLSDVLDSEDIRLIDIKLDVSTAQGRRLNTDDGTQSIILNVIQDLTDAQALLGGNVAQVYFGNGRKKDNPLNPQEVKNLIAALDLDSDIYISIKIKYYSNQLRKVNELDLKNVRILKQEVEFEGDSWETVADTLEETFYDNGRVGENNHQRFNDELTENNYESIVIINPSSNS